MANDVSRETAWWKSHAVAEAEPTDRIKRESTKEATTLASQRKGRKGQAVVEFKKIACANFPILPDEVKKSMKKKQE